MRPWVRKLRAVARRSLNRLREPGLSLSSISDYPDMVKRVLFGFFNTVNDIIHRPWAVLWACLVVAFVNLVADGTLFRLWSLHRDYASIQTQMVDLKVSLNDIDARLRTANSPAFVEKEARDRFDLVNQGDLVFVFSDDE